MDEIAERAGVSKPVLYQHFPGKLELYMALLTTSSDEIISGVRSALEATSDNAERVQATIELWFDYVAARGVAFRMVFESDMTNVPEVRDLVDRVINDSAGAIAEVIREDTGLSDPAAQLLAVSLVGMGQVGAQKWLSTDSSISREEAVQLVSGLAWRGIGGFPTQHNNEGSE